MISVPQEKVAYWHDSVSPLNLPELQGEHEADVVVIGAGIAGLAAAYLLAKAGRKVLVLESKTVASGVTGHTTGKVSALHGLKYSELDKRFGLSIAGYYAQGNARAVDMVASIIAGEQLRCDWQPRDNIVYTADPRRKADMQKEAKLAARLGLSARFEEHLPLPFPITGAVVVSGQGSLHAGKYLQGLAKALRRAGGHLYEHSKATRIVGGEDPRVFTRHGVVHAEDIIVATHVPTWPLLARGSYCAVEYPSTSYLVAAPVSSPLTGMYISPDKGHYSILPVVTETGPLLLVGGEGHVPGLGGFAKPRYERLARYASEHFEAKHISYRWQAYDYLGYDGLPLVGRLYPWSKHVYTATGFGKWGLSNGTLAGMVLRDILLGEASPLIEVLQPHRPSAVAAIPQAVLSEFKKVVS